MNGSRKPTLVAFGAAHLDRIVRLRESPGPHSVPATASVHAGGAAFNTARHVRALGLGATLFTPAPPGDVKAFAAGIDVRGWGTHGPVPSYTAVLTPSGELHVAASDMRAYDDAEPDVAALAALHGAGHVFLDANLPAHVLERICSAVPKEAAVYAAAVSPAKASRLRGCLRRLTVLFASRAEANALLETHGTGRDAARGLGRHVGCVVVSDGTAPLHVAQGGSVRAVVVRAVAPIEVTGAGDALAGGFVAGRMLDEDLDAAVRRGMDRARRTVLCEGPFPFDTGGVA